MNEQKALALLDPEPGAMLSEIRKVYQEIFNELQNHLNNDTTERKKGTITQEPRP